MTCPLSTRPLVGELVGELVGKLVAGSSRRTPGWNCNFVSNLHYFRMRIEACVWDPDVWMFSSSEPFANTIDLNPGQNIIDTLIGPLVSSLGWWLYPHDSSFFDVSTKVAFGSSGIGFQQKDADWRLQVRHPATPRAVPDGLGQHPAVRGIGQLLFNLSMKPLDFKLFVWLKPRERENEFFWILDPFLSKVHDSGL